MTYFCIMLNDAMLVRYARLEDTRASVTYVPEYRMGMQQSMVIFCERRDAEKEAERLNSFYVGGHVVCEVTITRAAAEIAKGEQA